MQETKLADAAFPALAFAGPRLRVRPSRPGAVERRRHPVQGRARRRRRRLRRRCRADADARSITATCGGVRVVSRLRAQRPRRRARALPVQAGVARPAAAPPRPPRAARTAPWWSCGDFNIAPEDRDVCDPARLRRRRPTSAHPSARPLGDAGGVGPRRRVPPMLARRRAGCSPGGTTAPATSTSTAACASTSCSATAPVAERVTVVRHRPQRPQGHAPSDHAPLVVDLGRPGA